MVPAPTNIRQVQVIRKVRLARLAQKVRRVRRVHPVHPVQKVPLVPKPHRLVQKVRPKVLKVPKARPRKEEGLNLQMLRRHQWVNISRSTTQLLRRAKGKETKISLTVIQGLHRQDRQKEAVIILRQIPKTQRDRKMCVKLGTDDLRQRVFNLCSNFKVTFNYSG